MAAFDKIKLRREFVEIEFQWQAAMYRYEERGGGWGGRGAESGLSLPSLCAVHIVTDTQMLEVAALLCKWRLDAVQPRLLPAASLRWMTAAVAAEARRGGKSVIFSYVSPCVQSDWLTAIFQP